ncbi:hypothetical protein [Ferruginibacter sp. SUN106]|uniref:hypothetical protein n=1 Tax=Ferruginibacter sp. SUN106 TaxID=2978348 RepID=UPI003D36F54A
MLKISIPTPCHEDWNAMTPNAQGRHCNACVKTVVDFTNMNDEEVKYFFLNKKEEKVCGRFRNEQLLRITIELPQNIFYIAMPVWKKFLAACLLVFSTTLFSCDTKVKGDITDNSLPVVTTSTRTMGPPSATKLSCDTFTAPPPIVTTIGFTPPIIVEDITQGDISIAPEPPKEEIGIIEEVPVAQTDTSVIDKLQSKTGEVMMIKTDSVKAFADTCNHSIFY